jgi:hypothetical protein
MRNEKGHFARGGAIAGAVLVGLSAANAFAADGTLKVEQDDPSAPPVFWNGNVGGGEFGVYDFVNNNASLTLLPISATAKVNSIVNGHGPFDFQTFCLEPGVHIDFNVDLQWTAATTVQLLGGGTRNLDPRTAYMFHKFWTAAAFSPAYNYTLGAGRSASAADLQLAIWFTEGVSAFNGGNTGLYTADAALAVAPGGSWFAFTGGAGFPGNLDGVRALNIVHNGALDQDLLAIFTTETPPVEPPGDCSGKTPGFWHNKNGCELVKDSGAGANWTWLNVINALPLVDGTDDGHLLVNVPLSKDGFNTISDFLVSGNNAKNMAQKLSQHLAAMTFNVLAGFADGDCLVYTGENADCIPGSPDTVSIGEVLLLAIDTLDTTDGDGDDYTPAGDALRDYQECLKNILDDANNNLNWVN